MKPLLKFSKVNYHNILEKILEKKDFTANTKSLLLSMLYKIETAYNDYKTVKVLVKTKESFINDIIETIHKKCTSIKLVEPSSEKGLELRKDEQEAYIENDTEIICFPTERALLVGITLLMEENFYVKPTYRMIDNVIHDFLKLAYALNIQECIYNFDGWSWNNQFESEYQYLYSVLYYNLVDLAGLDFIEGWRNNNSEDYIEKFTKILISKYSEENAKRVLLLLYRIALKVLVKHYKTTVTEILEEGQKIKDAIMYMSNKSKYMQDIYDKKRQINFRIKEIEKMMLDKEHLKQKYEELNESLPLDKQIFSVRRYLAIVKQERENLYNEIKNYNKKLDPKRYIQEKIDLEEKYLKFVDLEKMKASRTTLKTEIVQLQNKFLELKKRDIARLETKKEILNSIYILRYYKNLKLNDRLYIKTDKLLTKSIKDYERKLFSKAYRSNMFIAFTKNNLQNIEILTQILDTRIINFEDVQILAKVERDRIVIEVYDGEILEVSLRMNENVKRINLKLNKKVKLLL